MKTSDIKKLQRENIVLKKKVKEKTKVITEIRNLMSTVPDLLFQIDTNGIFREYSGKEKDLFAPPSEFIGKCVSDVLPEEMSTQHFECADKVIKTGKVQSFEYSLMLDDEERFFETRMVFQKKRDMFISIVREITARKKSELELIEAKKKIEINAIIHEEMNTVLKKSLAKKGSEINGLKMRIVRNIQDLVCPFVEKIKTTDLTSHQEAYLDLIQQNLDDISSPLMKGESLVQSRLTPSETQIVNLIKKGKTTKNISLLLSLSPKTIETHRRNIRKKMGYTNQKSNLRTILSSV